MNSSWVEIDRRLVGRRDKIKIDQGVSSIEFITCLLLLASFLTKKMMMMAAAFSCAPYELKNSFFFVIITPYTYM